MPLKFKYARKEDVPAEHLPFYVERNGAFVLDADGAVEKEKLDEFRQNNINLTKELKKFEGIDADEARKLLEKKQELEDGKVIPGADVQKAIDAKLNPVLKQLNEEKERAKNLQLKLEEKSLASAVTEAGTKRGVRPSAIPDLQARARGKFKLVEGEIVPVAEGETLTLDDWVNGLVADAPHLFETNSGGGAHGNGSGGAGFANHGTKNPWKKETWNLTEQGRITRANPTMANSLRVAAGK